MAYVEVDKDVRLFVQDLGSGSPVVLVAGFGMNHDVWDRQVRVLAEDHRVICVDQRGHGGSDAPLGGYDIDRLALDLCTVLDQLDVRDCTLVGWSFGGQVAFKVAAEYSGRVARLILVGSNAVRASRSAEFPFGREPEGTVRAVVADEHRDRLAARRATIALGFHGEPDSVVLDWLVRCSLRMPSWAAVACYRAMLYTDLIADIPKVTLPVLQIVGASDPVHSVKGARWLSERLADTRLAEIPECGHYPMIEAADDFDALLTDVAAL
jgi:pimeloyl-ACP methyl ester carboxylesterase